MLGNNIINNVIDRDLFESKAAKSCRVSNMENLEINVPSLYTRFVPFATHYEKI